MITGLRHEECIQKEDTDMETGKITPKASNSELIKALGAGMDYEKQQDTLSALQEARKWVQEAHDEAEGRHDTYGLYYMDASQYEIMQETERLLTRIDMLLQHLSP